MVRGLVLLTISLLACKGEERPRASERPQASGLRPQEQKEKATPAKPVLPETDAGIPTTGSIADQFAAEPEDKQWAVETEAKIKQRVPAADVACKTTRCRLTISGPEKDVSAALDKLESEQSLRGIAVSVLLSEPEKKPDGSWTVKAYARFNRGD